MAYYEPPRFNEWIGRNDGSEPDVLRWHQVIQYIDLSIKEPPVLGKNQQGVAFIGFCSDEGVRRNQGRVGAKDGPAAIRKACANLPIAVSHMVMVDAGNVVCHEGGDLEAAQQLLGEYVKQLSADGYLPIVLGGGHEVAWGGFLGIAPTKKKSEFGAINFDAHFDLRPVEPSNGNTSGTPFWQMREYCQKMSIPFHYLAIGIQQYCNTRRLFELAEEMGAPYVLAENFTNDQLERMLHVINGVIGNSDSLLLSIDMDVFAAAHAPGVSAPAFNGIAPNSMFKRFVRHVIFSAKVRCVVLAEVNPTYDVDGRTARLAASLCYDMVQAADMNAEYPS
jgi:formiminoglutamase